MEQLNIVGKRSGDGFVAHKATLVNALSRGLADRLMLMDFTIGRKGFLGYIKALAGSNIVKIVPASVDAGESQVNGHKRLKVVCGANTSYLDDLAWVGEKTPLTLCDVRISPNRTVQPNIGGLELSEALNRVLPFTAKEDNRPVLQCVLFRAKEGKLTLVSADGFRLAVVTLDYDGEGEALILRDDLRGIANALRRAHRVNLSFEASGESLDGMSLVIDTEITRYRWRGADGNFPDYEKLIPTDTTITAHFDTVEAGKAIASLRVLADSKTYPIDLKPSLDGGYIVMSSPDEGGHTAIPADIDGQPFRVRIDGAYLNEALRACGGMVDFKVTNAYSPVLFQVDGYQLVVMPMMTSDRQKPEPAAEPTAEPTVTCSQCGTEYPASYHGFRDGEDLQVCRTCFEQIHTEAEAEADTEAEPAEPEAEAEAEAVIDDDGNQPKRSRKKEPVAV